jgi:hypothetical protein
MVIHQRTHPGLDVSGCFGCKIATVNLPTAALAMERDGRSVTGGDTTREYVRRMFEKRRADGLPDPVPETAAAAKFAPAAGVARDKKYKEANNGL